MKDILAPFEEIKVIHIKLNDYQTTQIEIALFPEEEFEIIQGLRENVNLFAWLPTNMSGIVSDVACHQLSVIPGIKPIMHRKRKEWEKKGLEIKEEVRKSLEAKFI